MRLQALSVFFGAAALAACPAPSPETAGWPATPLEIELRHAQSGPAAGHLPMPILGEEDTVYVGADAFVTSRHVTAAAAYNIPEGVIIEVWLDQEGSARLEAATAGQPGGRIAVVIDSVAVGAPHLVAALRPGTAVQIPVRLGPVEASRLITAVEASW